jgi:hypothetical protein
VKSRLGPVSSAAADKAQNSCARREYIVSSNVLHGNEGVHSAHGAGVAVVS